MRCVFQLALLVGCLSVFFVYPPARVSNAQTSVVKEGTVSRISRELSTPREPLRRERLRFFLTADATSEGGGAVQERVSVMMQSRTIEGTVRENAKVRVEGEWDADHVLRAQRITDLQTQATLGYESAAPRFRENTQLALSGKAQNVEEKVAGHKGEWNQTEKIRFAVRVERALGPWIRGELIAVEMVKTRIIGVAPASGALVLVAGRWTSRNVLRADTITDEESGAITR